MMRSYFYCFVLTLAPLVLCAADTASTPAPASVNSLADGLAVVARYDYGSDRAALEAFEGFTRSQSTSDRQKTETALLELLGKAETKPGAKDWICRWLGVFGTPSSVPVLGRLVADEKLSHLAVYALMGQNTDAARAALAKALETASPALQPAVVSALGRTGQSGVIPLLIKNPTSASLQALGLIGTSEALTALNGLKVPTALQSEWKWARLGAASRMVKSGSSDSLLKALFSSLLAADPSTPWTIRVAAAQGLVKVDPAGAWTAIEPLLKDTNIRFRLEIAKLTAEVPDAQSAPVLAAFAAQDPAVQMAMLRAFALKKSAGIASLLKTGLASANAEVRVVAIEACGTANLPGQVSLLLPFLTASKEESDAAAASLGRLSDPASAQALGAAFTQSTGSAKAALLGVLANRLDRSAIGLAYAAAVDADTLVGDAATQALSLLAGGNDFAKLLELLPKTKTGTQRKNLEKALTRSVVLFADKDKAAEMLGASLKSVPADNRPALISSLGALGSPKATAEIKTLLQAPLVDDRKAVIRALSGVRNETVEALLLDVAKTGVENSEKILALRGFLDSIQSRPQSDDKKLDAYKTAWGLALRQEEKDAILASLKGMRGSRPVKLIEELTGVPVEKKPDSTKKT